MVVEIQHTVMVEILRIII